MNFMHRFASTLCVSASLVLLAAGCGGKGEEAPAETPAPQASGTPAPEAAAASTAAAATSTGIAGKVSYEGTPPERAPLETEGDPKCFAMHASEPLLSDREVVSPEGGVQWALVYVKNPPTGEYAVPEEEAMLNQEGCRYSPHVLAVRAGQKLSIHNNDPTLHNVRAIARENKPFNIGQPEGTAPRIKVFEKPEQEIRMKCDVHPWMTAYVFSMDHPFFAVTDANGQFTIDGLPAGDYTLVMWHEVYGTQEIDVTVAEGAPAQASFTVKPAAE